MRSFRWSLDPGGLVPLWEEIPESSLSLLPQWGLSEQVAFTSQEDSSHQNPNQLPLWSWASQTKVLWLSEPPSLQCFAVADWADKYTCMVTPQSSNPPYGHVFLVQLAGARGRVRKTWADILAPPRLAHSTLANYFSFVHSATPSWAYVLRAGVIRLIEVAWRPCSSWLIPSGGFNLLTGTMYCM